MHRRTVELHAEHLSGIRSRHLSRRGIARQEPRAAAGCLSHRCLSRRLPPLRPDLHAHQLIPHPSPGRRCLSADQHAGDPAHTGVEASLGTGRPEATEGGAFPAESDRGNDEEGARPCCCGAKAADRATVGRSSHPGDPNPPNPRSGLCPRNHGAIVARRRLPSLRPSAIRVGAAAGGAHPDHGGHSAGGSAAAPHTALGCTRLHRIWVAGGGARHGRDLPGADTRFLHRWDLHRRGRLRVPAHNAGAAHLARARRPKRRGPRCRGGAQDAGQGAVGVHHTRRVCALHV
mmetsp:Transcript_9760/g.32389  ORF Transcript_9760/g.32389 Transcript_9760/m.32389 type:complete len:289 (-) Transcript_9760:765-1631(-)